jgi:DNA-directed RNA polymerase subunit K
MKLYYDFYVKIIMDYPKVTKYEIARIIGLRAEQLARGAKPMIDIGDTMDVVKIATEEYHTGTIPLCIIRKLPDGRKVRIRFRNEKVL